MEPLYTNLSPFSAWLLKTTLQGSLLVCLILLIKLILRNRLPAKWHYCLWLILLVRLSLPWAPHSRLSIYNAFQPGRWASAGRRVIRNGEPPVATQLKAGASQSGPAETAASPTKETPAPPSSTSQQAAVPDAPATQESSQADAPAIIPPVAELPSDRDGGLRPRLVGIQPVLSFVWLTGIVLFGGYVLARNLVLWRAVKRERPVTDQEILDLLEDAKMQMGVQTILGVVVTDKIKSPALCGFVRPRLLLPQGLLEGLSLEELHYVFLHELAHLKRRDIYIGWWTAALQILHWFNPLLWLAFRRLRADQETATDALALSRMAPEEPAQYGRTIVSLLERFAQPHYVPSVAGILEEPSNIERRMSMIAKFKKNSCHWSPLAVTFIFLVACVSLTDARQKATREAPRHVAPMPTLRRVEVRGPGRVHSRPSFDARYMSDVDPETNNLVVRDLVTGKQWNLTSKGSASGDFADWSAISPDNTQVIYYWFNVEEEDFDLRAVGLDGSNDRLLWAAREGARSFNMDTWSPDSEYVYGELLGDDQPIHLVRVCIADGSREIIKEFKDKRFFTVSSSPGARYLAYDCAGDEASNRDIFIYDLEDKQDRPLVQHAANDKLLGWTPDGRHIFFASDRNGKWDGWLLRVDEGKGQGVPDMVKAGMGDVVPIGFTKNGSFYYEYKYSGWNVYTAALDPADKKLVGGPEPVRHFGTDGLPDWSPDGRYLAYLSQPDRDKPSTIRIHTLATGQEREIHPDLPSFRWLRWCADNRHLLLTDVAGQSVVYKLDVETGQYSTLIQRDQDGVGDRIRQAELSADGKTLAYRVRGRGNLNRLVVKDLATKQEKELLRTEAMGATHLGFASGWALSPDGTKIALCMREGSIDNPMILKIMPVGSGACTTVVEDGAWQVAWAAHGHDLLVTRNQTELWMVSAQGGESRKLLEWNGPVIAPRLHPDGQRLAFFSGARMSELWVMENFLPRAPAPVAKSEPMTTVRRIRYEWRGPFASLSPDGKYMSDRDWDTGTLVVRELATGETRTLAGGGSHETGSPLVSAISPDSREVAYLWWDPNTKASSLHVVGIDGSGDRLLCEGKYPMPRAWSADGQKILATVLENDVAQMVWISASDGSIQHIVDVNLGYLGKVDISPDGRLIAYDRPRGEDPLKRDIFVFDLRESRDLSVISHPADDKFLGWTPDGRHMFFVSNRTGTWDAWLLPVADGKPQGFPELARHGIGNISPIGFTPQGSYYYGHEQTLRDVFVAKLDLETGEFLSEPAPVRQSGATTSHDWSPDGLYLAYCTGRPDESQAVHIRTLATGRERTLSNNLPYIRWLRWSLDGRSILIDGYRRGDVQGVLFKIDVQTGQRSDIVRSTTEVLVRPEVSPDGKTLFYDRSNDPKSKTLRLIARDLESGREKELFRVVPPAQLTNRALSPDGQRFVLSIVPEATRPLAPVLKILSVAGGEPRELIQFGKSENLRAVGVTWTPDSRNVLFCKWRFPADKELELWRISAEGGEPRRLCSRKAFGHMRVHPDGQRVAFCDRSTTRGLWVIENFLPKAVAAAHE